MAIREAESVPNTQHPTPGYPRSGWTGCLTPEQLRRAAYDWGLTPYEYERILEGLGRQPTLTEIAMFSVEWCEHCGYPKSRNVLRMLPNRSARAKVLVGADSGGFYVTPDLAVVMKVESH